MAPKAKQELTFLVSTGPDDGTGEENRRRVRSLAALKSWPKRRKRNLQKYEDSLTTTTTQQSGAGAFLLKSPTAIPAEPSSILHPPHGSRASPNPTDRSTVAARQPLSRPGEARIVLISLPSGSSSSSSSAPRPRCTRRCLPTRTCHCLDCRLRTQWPPLHPVRQPDRFKHTKRTHPYATTTRTHLLTPPRSPEPERPFSGRLEPFNQYPVPWEPWHEEVLLHMMKIFAPRGWPVLRISEPEGLNWEKFCHQISLGEPAFFYVRLLFASGDLVRLGRFTPATTIYLRAQAVAAINAALSDPTNPGRACSDALILAVGRIAMHECFYGDWDAAHKIHRPAQARMIAMRGGLEGLEFPPLVKRLMRWADDLMSRQGKTRKFLADEGPKREYSIGQTVKVLDEWVPESGTRLKTILKTEDLRIDAKDGW